MVRLSNSKSSKERERGRRGLRSSCLSSVGQSGLLLVGVGTPGVAGKALATFPYFSHGVFICIAEVSWKSPLDLPQLVVDICQTKCHHFSFSRSSDCWEPSSSSSAPVPPVCCG